MASDTELRTHAKYLLDAFVDGGYCEDQEDEHHVNGLDRLLKEPAPLGINQYQVESAATAGDWKRIAKRIPPWVYCAIGLAEEAGEVLGKTKKFYRDDVDDDQDPDDARREAILLEMGDTLWYLAALAGHLGFSMEDIVEASTAKLAGRKDRGTMKGDGDDR